MASPLLAQEKVFKNHTGAEELWYCPHVSLFKNSLCWPPCAKIRVYNLDQHYALNRWAVKLLLLCLPAPLPLFLTIHPSATLTYHPGNQTASASFAVMLIMGSGEEGVRWAVQLNQRQKCTHQDLIRHSVLGNLGGHHGPELSHHYLWVTCIIFQHDEGKCSWKESKILRC